jgi:RND family efflux transporter MFP subunit
MSKHTSFKSLIRSLPILLAATVLCSAPLHAQTSSNKSTAADEAPPLPGAPINATVQWMHRVELSTPLTASVKEVLVETGDAVKKGQVLLRLDARAVQALALRAQAELTRLSVTRDEAENELHRAVSLHRRRLLSDHELQTARIEAAQAESDYTAAQAANAQAQLDLEHCTLRAPFDGVVVQRTAEPGETVVSSLKPESLLVVAETGHMRARAEVQRDVLAKIQRGQAYNVVVANHTYPGMVKYVGLEPLDGLGGQYAQYALVVEFNPPADAGLYAGQPAQLTLP